jgi:Histidine phosphatase superfamily (branch 1)
VTTADGTARWLFVFARHAESTANADLVLSTDPSRPTPLTERGRAQARALGAQLANVPIDLAVSSRLPRARETVSIALADRPVPVTIEPSFDEIQVGDLDGKPSVTRARCAGSWRGPHRSRSSSLTSSRCGISRRRPRPVARPRPARTLPTRFRTSSTSTPSGVRSRPGFPGGPPPDSNGAQGVTPAHPAAGEA